MLTDTLRDNLSALASAYSAKTKTTPGMIGKIALKDNTFFPRAVSGNDGFNVKTYDRLVAWFSDNWPDGAKWPASVKRPAPATEDAA